MKKIKFEVLLRDTIVRYSKFNLHLSKCNSAFLLQMLIENDSLTASSCDFGTWYFSRGNEIDLPSINEVEKPYINVYTLFKKLENQFNIKLSKLDRLKKKIPFVKADPNPITVIIDDLQINCLLLISALKKIELEFEQLNVITSPLSSSSTRIFERIEANLALNASYQLETNKVKEAAYSIPRKTNNPKRAEKDLNSNTMVSAISLTKKESYFLSKDLETVKDKSPNEFLNSSQEISFGEIARISTDSSIGKTIPNQKKFNEVFDSPSSRNQEWNSLMAMKRMMDNLN